MATPTYLQLAAQNAMYKEIISRAYVDEKDRLADLDAVSDTPLCACLVEVKAAAIKDATKALLNKLPVYTANHNSWLIQTIAWDEVMSFMDNHIAELKHKATVTMDTKDILANAPPHAGNWKLEESQEGIQAAVALSNAKKLLGEKPVTEATGIVGLDYSEAELKMLWHTKATALKANVAKLNNLLPKDMQVYWDTISSHQLRFTRTDVAVSEVNTVEDVNVLVLGMIASLSLTLNVISEN